MAAPAHHDADVVMESLRDVVIRLISQVTAPAHNNADTVMEALYNMTNVLINDVSTPMILLANIDHRTLSTWRWPGTILLLSSPH